MTTTMDSIALLEVSDVSGQNVTTVEDVDGDASVGELIDALLEELDLHTEDTKGRPLTYHARLEREGRHLHTSELVGEALETGDQLVLQPNIDAGGESRE